MLNLIDESTRECFAIRVARRLRSHDVIDTLADAMVLHGIPEHIRSDNGPSSLPKTCARGSPAREPKRLTSNPAPLGRTAIANRSTPGSEMNSAMEKSSTR